MISCKLLAFILFCIEGLHSTLLEPPTYNGFQIIEVGGLTELKNEDTFFDYLGLPPDKGLEIFHANAFEGTVHVLVTPEMKDLFLRNVEKKELKVKVLAEDVGWMMRSRELLKKDMADLRGKSTFERYMNLEEIQNYLKEVAKKFPNKVKLSSIGRTFEEEDIKMVTITNGVKRGRPIVFIEAGIHAREWISVSSALYMIDQLTKTNGLTEDVEWRIVPVANPDGYNHTWSKNRFWRKNRSIKDYSGCIGVDLNRNFDSYWNKEGTSASTCSQVYGGKNAFSEAETASIRDAILRVKDRVKAYVSLHSYGQFILYPPGGSFLNLTAKTQSNLDSVASRMSEAILEKGFVNYTVGPPADLLYPASGLSMDWAMLEAKIPLSFTFELRDTGNNGFLLPDEEISMAVQDVWIAMDILHGEVRKLPSSASFKHESPKEVVPTRFSAAHDYKQNYNEISLDESLLKAITSFKKTFTPDNSKKGEETSPTLLAQSPQEETVLKPQPAFVESDGEEPFTSDDNQSSNTKFLDQNIFKTNFQSAVSDDSVRVLTDIEGSSFSENDDIKTQENALPQSNFQKPSMSENFFDSVNTNLPSVESIPQAISDPVSVSTLEQEKPQRTSDLLTTVSDEKPEPTSEPKTDEIDTNKDNKESLQENNSEPIVSPAVSVAESEDDVARPNTKFLEEAANSESQLLTPTDLNFSQNINHNMNDNNNDMNHRSESSPNQGDNSNNIPGENNETNLDISTSPVSTESSMIDKMSSTPKQVISTHSNDQRVEDGKDKEPEINYNREQIHSSNSPIINIKQIAPKQTTHETQTTTIKEADNSGGILRSSLGDASDHTGPISQDSEFDLEKTSGVLIIPSGNKNKNFNNRFHFNHQQSDDTYVPIRRPQPINPYESLLRLLSSDESDGFSSEDPFTRGTQGTERLANGPPSRFSDYSMEDSSEEVMSTIPLASKFYRRVQFYPPTKPKIPFSLLYFLRPQF